MGSDWPCLGHDRCGRPYDSKSTLALSADTGISLILPRRCDKFLHGEWGSIPNEAVTTILLLKNVMCT